MPSIPDMPEGLTPAYLTDLLHADQSLPQDSSVRAVEQSQVGDGTGMMAELARLNLSYNGERGEAPDSSSPAIGTPWPGCLRVPFARR